MSSPEEKQQYTYADYHEYGDNERWELIEGVPCAMSPSPPTVHQDISRELTCQLAAFLKGKPYRLFAAPFDVRLNADGDNNTVVQPDLVVICDRSKIDEKGCKGAPDMVIEILSPATARRDRMVKFNQYRQAGVREYWIADPDTKTVQTCILRDGLYVIAMYCDTDTVPVHVLDGCMIDLHPVFEEWNEESNN